MERVRMIQAKKVKGRARYNNDGADIVISNILWFPFTLWIISLLGIPKREPFFFTKGEYHINAKFSIKNKVHSIRTSERVFLLLMEIKKKNPEVFNAMIIDACND